MAFIDPYVTNTKSKENLNAALSDLPPVANGAADGTASVLQLYVPAEHTTLDLGAGATPGIRMITDTHAHLTALVPLSTLSLGVAGGKLPSGATPGINIYTDANKKETIQGETHETYGATKDESVRDVWTETGHNAKTESIAGTVTQNFNSEHNLTVGKPADYRYKCSKTETVGDGGGGDYAVTVHGDKKEHVQNNLEITVGGNATISHLGQVTTLWTGKVSSVAIDNHDNVTTGNKTDYFTGHQCSVNTGTQVSKTRSLSMSTNESIAVTQNLVNFNLNGYTFSRSIFDDSKSATKLIRSLISIFK